ncbi:MAG: TldD/PmbA family protein [Spirochaetales bacterium]|nr:TldD/PmbA family protein [Spirochaetales bacterium]
MLSRKLISEVLLAAMSTGADFAEVFLERTLSKNIQILEDRVHMAQGSDSSGMGLRLYKGLETVYGSTGDLSRDGVLSLAGKVAGALSQTVSTPAFCKGGLRFVESIPFNISPVRIVPSSVPNKDKIEILRMANDGARSYDSAISQVSVALKDIDRSFVVANSDGLYTGDRQIYTRLTVSSIASSGTENQAGFCGPGRQAGLEMFQSGIDPAWCGREASRIAMVNLKAVYCKGGTFPVAIENGFGGVIFHESTGHSLEATQVAYGNSEFCSKLGQLVANPKVTAIDDGTIPGAWGSVNIDDEGRPGQKNILIENGVLKSYMIDTFNARRMEGLRPTGNARRQNFQFAPTSRMTNTYIAPGNDSDEDIIGSIENGIYCKKMGGGSVNPITGAFNFAVCEGYMIRNGKICEPVRGATLIGKGSQVIKDMDMVGTKVDMGQGMCGSLSGSVPVNVGQPLIRVKKITVGGR